MFIKEALWSCFLLLFACSTENADTRLLHGVHLDIFQILRICHQLHTVSPMVGLLEKINQSATFICVWRLF